MDQSLVSQYLTKLKDKGILICRRKGKEMHYEVHHSAIDELTDLLSEWVGYGPVIRPYVISEN